MRPTANGRQSLKESEQNGKRFVQLSQDWNLHIAQFFPCIRAWVLFGELGGY